MLFIIIFTSIIIFSIVLIGFFSFGFSKRQDNHPLLTYFTAKDFPNLEADPAEFLSAKNIKLKGFFYYYDRPAKHKALLIMPHGIGAGHHAYMHWIESFCAEGYLVFSYDNTGCQLSEGKGIRGIPQSIVDLKYAFAYIQSTVYASYPIHVIGHSWGGYAAIRSEGLSPKVGKIVAIAPLDNPTTLLSSYLPLFTLLKPWIWLYHALFFGRLGITSTAHLLRKAKTPILVISGDQDEAVPYKQHFKHYERAADKNSFVHTHLAKGRRHNPYLSSKAEAYVLDTILAGVRSIEKEKDVSKKQAFSKSIDYRLVGQHDKKIMKLILEFLS
jgi:alpha-beta hydrolase superfamily lysophospholipase